MKMICFFIAAFSLVAYSIENTVTNAISFPDNGAVALHGRVGNSADQCIHERAYSQWARGKLYDEAENAFRTHWDDLVGGGGWQNEYWGKTMLCFAGAAAYANDPGL